MHNVHTGHEQVNKNEHNFLPFIKIYDKRQNSTLNILIDSGANKNILRPGILQKAKKIKPTITKNFCGSKVISSKGRATLLGSDLPAVPVYEMDFHNFFHGLIGSETLSKFKATLDYINSTLNVLDKTIKFHKYHIQRKPNQFNHFVTMQSDSDGDWVVTKPSKLTEHVLIEPGLYKSKHNSTTFIVRTNKPQPPEIPHEKLFLKVNNFEVHNFYNENKQPEDITTERIESLIRTNHLSKLEKQKLLETLEKHNKVIPRDNEKLTATTRIKHKINTTDDNPIYTKTYRYPHAHKITVKEQIDDMLENGIITHSESPWNAPIWVVPKKSDASGKRKFRVVIDYRKLNDKTIDDRHPIPQIEDILDNLGRSCYFTTLDLKSGFHQIELDEKSRQKTAFSTDLGHYEFLRMPFGLKNAPATFQRAMNSILGNLIGTVCYVYLDDIIIFGKNLTEHLENLGKVLEKLALSNLKIQLDKCEFLKRDCEFLGHVVTSEGVKTNPDKIKEILNWNLPKSQKEIKQFLGLLGYYRKFIKDYSKLAYPMTKYLKKDKDVDINDPQYVLAFEKCKILLTTDPILAHPDYDKPFVLTTDASNYAIGAVLSQINDGKDHPVAFASRTLNKHETNYSTTEKEALAIIWSVGKFNSYLYGNKFTLVTDHKPLTFIKTSTKNLKVLRWRLELENYDYTVEYKTGKTNVVADALSRKLDVNVNENDDSTDRDSIQNNPTESDANTVHSTDTSDDYFLHFTERPINAYRNQIIFRHARINTTIQETVFPNYKRIIICRDNLSKELITESLKEFHNGKQTAILAPENTLQLIQEVYREHFSDASSHFVITQNMVEDVTSELRQDALVRKEHETAHRGIQEVEKQLKRSYFFPNMTKRIRIFNNACRICFQHKYERKPYNIKITPRPIEKAPFQRIHMDIFGMDKHNYLSIICAFSKHLQLVPIETRNALDIQNALTTYFANFRTPRTIVCDHEASFTSIQLKAFLADLGVQLEFASSSESNGQIEKTHSTVIELFNTNKHKYPELRSPEIMNMVTSLYNETVHSSTSFTPNEIVFNQRNLINPNEISPASQKIFDNAIIHLNKARRNMEKYNDEKEDAPTIEVEQEVFIKKPTRKKIDPRFTATKCTENMNKTFKIPRNVKRNKNKIKRLRKTNL